MFFPLGFFFFFGKYTAAAKLLQSCPALCDPIDRSPPGSSVPGILQARIVEWVAISFSNACMHSKRFINFISIFKDPTLSLLFFVFYFMCFFTIILIISLLLLFLGLLYFF